MPEIMSADDFAKMYGQPQQPAPQPQQPEMMSADDFAKMYGQPAQPAAPDPLSSQNVGPAAKPTGRWTGADPSKMYTPENVQAGKDLGREIAQDALFNYGDEAIAGVRSLLGEDYAKALEDERQKLKEGEQRLGAGGRAASEAVSFMLPMGPVAKLVQRIAGPGAGLMRTALASSAVMAPVGGVSAIGAMDDKSNLTNDAEEFAKGAAETAGTTFGIGGVALPIAKGATAIGGKLKDFADRGRELFRADNPVPLNSTTNYAVQRIADEAEKGGSRTGADVTTGLNANAVPGTPSALVNSGNDRIVALGTDSARKLQNPNVARLENGQRRDDNVFAALQDAQATNAAGQTQGDAARERLFDNANVDPWERDLSNVRQHDQQRLALGGEQLADVDATPPGQPFRAGQVPGAVAAITADPYMPGLYRQASRDVSVAGARDSIHPDHIPLLPDDYAAEMDRFQNGQRATQPVALTDNNVPMPILSQIRQQISALSAAEDPVMRARGARLMGLYDQITAGAHPMGPVGQLSNINRNMHGIHNRQEDIAAGYRVPTQTGITRADALAKARTQQPMQTAAQAVARQNDVGLGLTHGVVDATKANDGNLGALADNLFSNPDFRAAYDEFTQGRNPQARGAEAIGQELENIGNMQGVGSLLRNASDGRPLNPESLPAEAARAAVKFHISPSFGTAWFLQKWLRGETQARHGEVARLLTDTTGEGMQRLMEELQRRADRRTALPPVSRIAITNEIARQLSQAAPNGQ